ncbi:MAG: ferredoxin [Cyclobacteriaceae bacterium]
MKIIHYRKKCIGCGICYELAPMHWRMSRKDGKANLLGAIVKKEIHQLDVKTTLPEFLYRVEEACPVRVIKID